MKELDILIVTVKNYDLKNLLIGSDYKITHKAVIIPLK